MLMTGVIESDRVAIFDCDDTLILWKYHGSYALDTVTINGRVFQIHSKHLQKINDYIVLGFQVIVWSNSGYRWAKQVAEALGIADKVLVMCKPHRVFDDVKDLGETIKHGYLEL